MNFKVLIFLASALLGFITIFLIGNRYKNNRQTNIYLIALFLTSSLRFLFNGLADFTNAATYLRQIDLFHFVFSSPLVFLYFKKLVSPINTLQKKDIVHVIPPILLFIIINHYVTNYTEIVGLKIRMIIIFLFNLTYAVKSYLLLRKSVWKRNSDILVINQQNMLVKKWTFILFGFFTLIIVSFIFFFATRKAGLWYQYNKEFLWINALLWILLYIKVLYSPEFLYGYDVFQNKIKEYKKHKIVFDNIWVVKNPISISNLQHNALQEKLTHEIENYILQIEHLALNTPLYFSESFKIQDLSNKLSIPKSHVAFVFKYHAKISFNDFKKIIRIQKGITLIENGFLKNNSMESLAEETGFSSYSAFFKSFKNIIGMSPKEYCNKNKTENMVEY